MLVVVSRISTCCLLDTTVDRIVRHVVCFCFRDNITKFAVVVRIRTASFDCHNNFTTDHGKDLTFFGIIFFFFMLDVRKF